jgi:hypothetical protein
VGASVVRAVASDPEKLELRSIAELTKYAIREGLTSSER